jgi:hypothetical protein
VRIREAGRRRRLVAAAAAVLWASVSCQTTPVGGQAVDLRQAKSPQELTALLDSIASRSDAEACLARARIYARLRELDGTEAMILLARGDAADVDLLSRAAPEDLKAESAERLARHFLERARRRPSGAGSPFQGPLGARARRFTLLTIASTFAEYAPRDLRAGVLEELSTSAGELAADEAIRPEVRRELEKRSKAASLAAAVVRAAEDLGEVTPEARRFAEVDVTRHLDEATRAADQGTREKAARGDPGRIIESYVAALAHYLVARECLVAPTPAQEHALSGMEIVVHSICELLSREP